MKVKKSVQKSQAPDDARAEARRRQIMQEAAKLFGSRGFEATTIRDIASAAGILGGSIYYHFGSKEDIFLAVHSAGMETITNSVLEAISDIDDPWEQLEAAAVAHCNALLSSGELPVIVSPYYSESLKTLRPQLIAQRDRYDKIMAGIVERLDLPPGIDKHIFRLHFLGALNWLPTWYRPKSGMLAADIGRQLVAMVRR
ncbi:TetR/AcrR family transcriptional regulator [Aminobacter sp. LjRoot7]|uniref:TetR/AcrR family transcriptional regulator n=1 Tax=Aminobacter sp. LjRoot7 TaxID=3342335 RepID=UPI003ED09A7D